jgi:hypothetical protein
MVEVDLINVWRFELSIVDVFSTPHKANYGAAYEMDWNI